MVSGLHPSVTPAPKGALAALGRLVWGSFYGAAPRSSRPLAGAVFPPSLRFGEKTPPAGGRAVRPPSVRKKEPQTFFLGYRLEPARS